MGVVVNTDATVQSGWVYHPIQLYMEVAGLRQSADLIQNTVNLLVTLGENSVERRFLF